GAVAVAQVDDLERDTLLAQCHREGSQDEGRRVVPRQERLLQLRPAAEADRLEDVAVALGLVDEVGHRAGEVAGHRQIADAGLRRGAGAPGAGLAQVQLEVQAADGRQPRRDAGDDPAAGRQAAHHVSWLATSEGAAGSSWPARKSRSGRRWTSSVCHSENRSSSTWCSAWQIPFENTLTTGCSWMLRWAIAGCRSRSTENGLLGVSPNSRLRVRQRSARPKADLWM